MAPLNHTLLRAQRVKSESRMLRVQAARVRAAARNSCTVCHVLTHEVADQRARRDHASRALGTWPYWAPASSDLLRVLVVA